MARAALGWSRADLSRLSGVSARTIEELENNKVVPRQSTLQQISKIIETHGFEFADGGVRPRRDIVRLLTGPEAIEEFFSDVYQTASTIGGEFLVSGVNEQQFLAARTKENAETYRKRMNALNNINYKVLISEDDPNPNAEAYIEYRVLPSSHFTSVPFYIYGNKLAIIIWGTIPQITILDNQKLTEAYREQFYLLWDNIAKEIAQ